MLVLSSSRYSYYAATFLHAKKYYDLWLNLQLSCVSPAQTCFLFTKLNRYATLLHVYTSGNEVIKSSP